MSRRSWLVGWLLFVAAVPAWGGEAVIERMRRDVTYLAAPEREGRGVATRGIEQAAAYIAAAFQNAGLKPAGTDGTYFQPFTMPGGTLEGTPRLSLRGPLGQRIELTPGRRFDALGMSHSGKAADTGLVFAGYGLTVKELDYDDYAGLDVAGKVVVVLRDTPRAGSPDTPFGGDKFDRRQRTRYASLAEKMANAKERQAAGILFVNNRHLAADGDDLMTFSYVAAGRSSTELPAFHVSRELVETMLHPTEAGLLQREQDIDRDLKPRSTAVPGWTTSFEVTVRRTIDCKNVVGYLEGSGPLAKETVVIGAHYDHLGYGGDGSLSGLRRPEIHHGADDNASGTTALIELARRFGAMSKREGRRLVFIAFSAEESGLLGSVHYCKSPPFPLADTTTMINLDMVGRIRPDKENNKDKLIVYGVGSAKGFEAVVDRLNQKHGFAMKKTAGPTGGADFSSSDHYTFFLKRIPVFFLFTDDHKDYHRPSDTADKINVPGLERVVDLTLDLATAMATGERPQYIEPPARASTPGNFPRIGIRPSYGDDKEGVLLDGVVPGMPAAKAGLKEGDRIVEVGGKVAKDLTAYMTLLGAHKKGEEVELGVLREGKKLTVKVKPE